VASTGEAGGTVEVGTLTVLHNLEDFQVVRTVTGRVGPDAGAALFTPDVDLRDGLLSLRIRAEGSRDRTIWFNAARTGLGLPGPARFQAGPTSPTTPAARTPSQPGADGYIRDWLALGPVPYKGDSTGGVLATDDLGGEKSIRPRPGQRTFVRGAALRWIPVHSSEPHINLNHVYDPTQWAPVESAFGYLATYLVAEDEIPNLTMRLDYDDAVRVWLNGEEIVYGRDGGAWGGSGDPNRQAVDPAVGERPLAHHGYKADLALKKGQNVVILKVCNDRGRWAVGLRFKDIDGKPVSGYRVATNPQ
jgi:hypothetical protein